LTVQNGAILQLNNGTVMFNNGTTTIQSGGSLNIVDGGIFNGTNSAVYQSTLATLRFVGTIGGTTYIQPQILPPSMHGSVSFNQSLSFRTFIPSGSSVVAGFVTVASFSTLNTGTNTLELSSRGESIGTGSINANSGGVLALSNGAVLWNGAGLNVQSGSTLRLDGTGQVLGPNGVNYIGGSNLLYIGGSTRLATPNEIPTQSFLSANLGINKTAGTSLELWGARNLSGAGSILTLTSGTIRTATMGGVSLLTQFNAVPAAVLGGNFSSFIDGPFLRQMNNGNYLFPTGSNGQYLPLMITNATASFANFRAQAFSTSTNGTAGQGVQSLSGTEYWMLQRQSGTFTSGQIGVQRPNIQPADVLATTTSTLPLAPLVAMNTSISAGPFGGVNDWALSSGLVSNASLFPLSNTAFFALGVSTGPPVNAGFGSALSLNGTTQFGTVPTGYNASPDFTVEALVNPSLLGTLRSIVSKSDCANGGYDVMLDGAGRVVVMIFTTCAAGNSDTITSTSAVPLNAWSHIAVTRNSATNQYAIFINGIPDVRRTIPRSPGASTALLTIGARSGGGGFFTGQLDEIRLWNTNLSTHDFPTEAAIPRYRGIEVTAAHPRSASLTGYWRFNNLPGATTPNSAGGAAMTLTASPPLVAGATNCSVIADVAAPLIIQLPGNKQGGTVTFATIGVNGGSTLATVSLASSGLLTYTPNSPITATNVVDTFSYRVFDGLGSVSTATVFVHFAPSSSPLLPLTIEARVPALLPLQAPLTSGGMQPFTVVHQPTSFVQPTQGTLSTVFTTLTQATLSLLRNLRDVYGMGPSLPLTITPVFTPSTLAFSASSSTGTQGLPPMREFLSTTRSTVVVGVYNAGGMAAQVTSGSLNLALSPLAGGTAQFIIANNTVGMSNQALRAVDSVQIIWLNPPLEGGATQATLTAALLGQSAIRSTSSIVTVRSSAVMPNLIGFSPVGGNVGTTVTITGVNLGAVMGIQFGSVNATTYNQISSTQVTVVVPNGITTGPITLQLANGTVTSSTNFLFVPPPIVDAFDPPNGTTGRVVTVNGFNFIAPLQVFFGDSLASAVSSVSPTELLATVGGGATGRVRVVTLGGSAVSDSTFRFIPRPFIANLNPVDIARGGFVTMTGANLDIVDSLFVGNLRITDITVVSPTTIRFRSDSVLNGVVRIVTQAGTTTSSVSLRHLPPPTIRGFSPSVGGLLSRFTVNGTNFVNVTSLTVGTITFANITVVSPTEITALIAEGNAQSASVQVGTAAGIARTDSLFRLVMPPQLGGIEPSVSGAGQFITITGANFSTGVQPIVQIALTQSDSVRIISSTTMIVRIPSNAQTGAIVITTPGGVAISTQAYLIVPPPVITDFEPTSAGNGGVVTIRGQNFYRVQRVRFGSITAASFVVESPNILRAQVGIGESGLVTVETGQGSTTSTQRFEYIPTVLVPVITAFSPSFGIRGDVIRITGRNFRNATRVSFGGVGATFTVQSDSVLNATVAGGATGKVQITNPIGIGTSLLDFRFVGDSLERANETPLQKDSSILARFYATTSGSSWFEKLNWLTDAPVSSWAGVRVSQGRIIGLQLANNGLSGTLPTFLAQLTDLEEVDLSFNELDGEIPASLAQLPKLRVLKLNNNRLAGLFPEAFGTRATLEVLHLQNNQIGGTVTSAICSQTTLRELNLASNQLEGTIPPCLGTFSRLQILNISGNRFSDTIPASLGDLTALRELNMASNRLTGRIPNTLISGASALAGQSKSASLQGTPELRTLDVSNNQLSGLPVNIGQLRNLEILKIGNNLFGGAIPPLRTLLNLRVLEAQNNTFGGPIPEELGLLRQLRIVSLANNRLQGLIPAALGGLDSLQILNVSNNLLTDSLPQRFQNLRNLQSLYIANNRITSLPNLTALRRLEELNIENNRLTFEHCEPYIFLRNFTFAPQDSVGERSERSFATGRVVEIPANVGGQTLLYQWLKDGVIQPLQRSSSLRFPVFSRRDTGVYVCRISSTEPRLSALTLVTRPIVVRALPPVAPQGRVVLLSPVINAVSVPARNVVFGWRTIDDASSYEIQISSTATFENPVISETVGARGAISIPSLAFLTRYFWRVRGANDGVAGAWSEVRSFTTLEESEPMTVEQLDFGSVSVNSISPERRLVLRNATPSPLVVLSVRLDNEEQTASVQHHFRIVSQPQTMQNGSFVLDSTIEYGIIFQPLSPGYKSSKVTIQYRLNTGTVEQTRTYITAVQGFGSVLSAMPLNFDTIVVGRGAGRVQALQVTNRAVGNAQIIRIALTERSLNLGFSLDETIREYRFTRSGESTSFLVRCNPKQEGNIRGEMMLISNIVGDTVFVPLTAYGRALSRNDVLLSTKMRMQSDLVAPGTTTRLEIMIDSIRILEQSRLITQPVSTLLRVGQTRFATRLRMNPQVLIPSSKETKLQFLRIEQATGMALYDVSMQSWSVRDFSTPLISFDVVAVAGTTASTTIDMMDLVWDKTNALPGSEIVPDSLKPTTFTARVSQAGGTRLIAPRDTSKFVIAINPNPANDVAEITYSFAQIEMENEITIEVLNVNGMAVRNYVQKKQSAGEYTMQISLRNIPSGSYLVRIRSGVQESTRPLQIIR
jgi:Leucine-rich repeat (LRR) protein